MAHTERLSKLLGDLEAYRIANWDPDALKVNIDQRRTLVQTADPGNFIKVGDAIAPFELNEVDGGVITLDSLTANGPAVLVFFRFAGCPTCNIVLPYYQRQLYPTLEQWGVPLVAISPQRADRLVEIKRQHDLRFSVATDTGNSLGRRFGILYSYDEPSRKAAIEKGAPIGDVTGTGTWELPMPSVIVVDSSKKVRYVDVNPDWLVRTEAEPVLDAVSALTAVSAS
jgi:peroxiredoxin